MAPMTNHTNPFPTDADTRKANRAYGAELRRIENGGSIDLADLLGETPVETLYPVGSFVAAERRGHTDDTPLERTYLSHPKWAMVEGHGHPAIGATLRLRDADGTFTVFASTVTASTPACIVVPNVDGPTLWDCPCAECRGLRAHAAWMGEG